MLNFKIDFYKKIFQSLDINAVLMKVDSDGKYFPVHCSREFLEMMECTEEEFIKSEGDNPIKSIRECW